MENLHTAVDISSTTYLPRLVYLVCERPLAEHAGCSLTLARRTNPQFGPETSIKVTLAALQHCCTSRENDQLGCYYCLQATIVGLGNDVGKC